MMVLAMLRMPAGVAGIEGGNPGSAGELKMPPPLFAELPEIVELVRVRVELSVLRMPPPLFAELPEIVELVTVAVLLPLKMPPPLKLVDVLPEIVELETVRVPRKL